MYLLDTNIVSELRRPRPDQRVLAWIGNVPPDSTYLSVITLGEIAKGVAKSGRTGQPHAQALAAWLERLTADYGERVLPIDAAIALRWGRLVDDHPQFPVDMLLAASAIERGLTVVTRNEAHFAPSGVAVLNPFGPAPRTRRPRRA